jgi:hypothetical protein
MASYLGAAVSKTFPVKLEPVLCRCTAPWANDLIWPKSFGEDYVRSDTAPCASGVEQQKQMMMIGRSPSAACDLRSIFEQLVAHFDPGFFLGQQPYCTTGATPAA